MPEGKLTKRQYKANVRAYSTPLHEVLIANGYQLLSKITPNLRWIELIKEDDKVAGKILVSKKYDENKQCDIYLYFNTTNEIDRGNIIDFARNRNLNPNDLLDKWKEAFGNEHTEIEKIPILSRSDTGKANIEFHTGNYRRMLNADLKNSLLLENRGIYPSTAEAYSDSLKQDQHTNLVIPNYTTQKLQNGKNDLTLSGYTTRLNRPLTHHEDGTLRKKPYKFFVQGNKGIEVLIPNNSKKSHYSEIENLVITESIVDTLSFIQLKKLDSSKTIAISTNGNFGEEKMEEIILSLIERLNEAREKFGVTNKMRYILAMDNDEKGKSFKDKLEKTLIKETKSGVHIYTPFAKDCNDDLRLSQIIKNNEVNSKTMQSFLVSSLNDYKHSTNTQKRANILEALRKIDKIKPLPNKFKEDFNAIGKHKSIKDFEIER